MDLLTYFRYRVSDVLELVVKKESYDRYPFALAPAEIVERILMAGYMPTKNKAAIYPLKYVAWIAVGTLIAERPPHRTERAQFGHSAPTSGV